MPLDIASGASNSMPAIPPSPSRNIIDELDVSFKTYSFSVIYGRALPDARDGLKPVHRRILFSMHEANYGADKPHRKSARIVGDVMGKYHPHGDSAIYDAMVRMAQPFSLRVPLIDGQGNFGSLDGDPAAAMRYTEARLARPAELILADIDELSNIREGNLRFIANYDGSEWEPTVLPSRLPNLLINGADGIAVGLATKMPPHNAVEAIDATLAMLRHPSISLDALMEIMPGPDFPTGATIYGRAGIRKAFESGRGSIVLRGTATPENFKEKGSKVERRVIAITELPYQVNKENLVKRIAELAEPIKGDKNVVLPAPIPGINDVRDESDRDGIRVVVELERDADENAVLAGLYRLTELQISYSISNVALDLSNGTPLPETLSLRRMLQIFIDHRREVVRERSLFRLEKARHNLHLQAGLLSALDLIDAVVATVRGASNQQDARSGLMQMRFPVHGLLSEIVPLDFNADISGDPPMLTLSEVQAKHILDMRLHRLTGADREDVAAKARALSVEVKDLLHIINDAERADEVIAAELEAAKVSLNRVVAPRRTRIADGSPDGDDDDLAMIPRENVLVTLTRDGYIKRVPTAAYRTQKRGGTGKSSAKTGEDDAVTLSFPCTTHASLLAFTQDGMCYAIPVHRLPAAEPRDRGRSIVNFCEHLQNRQVAAILPREPDVADSDSLIFMTSGGDVRRNSVNDFAQVRSTGKLAMRFGENDPVKLVSVLPVGEADDVMLFTSQGSAIRFPTTDLRVMASRESTGVRGIQLGLNDSVVGAAVVPHGQATPEEREIWCSGQHAGLPDERRVELEATERFILTVSANGFGKRSSTHMFRITARGGKGVTAAKLTGETGALVAAMPLEDIKDLMVGTSKGKLIRMKATDVATQGRDTRGSRLMRLDHGDAIISVIKIDGQEDDEPGVDLDGAV